MSTPDPTPREAGDPPIEQQVAELREQVTAMGAALAEVLKRTDATAVTSWLTITGPDAARALLSDLHQWVAQVWGAYPGSPLPTCWALHPWLVEELWVSMQLWLLAERKPGDYRVRDAWHDRSRPGVTRRLRESDAGHCEPTEHVPGALAGTPVDVPSLDAIAERWATTRTVPEPTLRSTT